MERIYSIQYIRAVAALMVVAFHAHQRVSTGTSDVHDMVFELGQAGVDLFFVISGFIIWTIGVRDTDSPLAFFLRRLLRVFPIYWIATLAMTAAVMSGALGWLELDLGHVLKSLFFVPHYSPSIPGKIFPVLVPGWTLNYEIFFYLIFAVTLLLPRQFRLAGLCTVLAGLVVLGVLLRPEAAWAVTYTSPLLLEFLGGCLAGALWKAFPGGVRRNATVLAAGILLFALLAWNADPDDPASRALRFGLPAVLIVSAAAGLGRTVPHWRWLERLGDASYSIYLFHLFPITAMAALWARLPHVQTPAAASAFTFIAVATSVLAGLAIYVALERPLHRSLAARLARQAPRRHLRSAG